MRDWDFLNFKHIKTLTEFPVRLGGKKSNEGLVEVFYGGLWGSVRAENWDLKDALVFCRQLGFHQVQSTYQKTTELRKQVFWFGDFDCKGSELTLGSCKHRLIAQAVWGYEKPMGVFVYCGNGTGTRISLKGHCHGSFTVKRSKLIEKLNFKSYPCQKNFREFWNASGPNLEISTKLFHHFPSSPF